MQRGEERIGEQDGYPPRQPHLGKEMGAAIAATAFRELLGTFAAVFRCHGASSPDARFAFFQSRLGKVSLSRVCHPQPSPVPPRNSAPAFLLG
jgi:hypothetical protein